MKLLILVLLIQPSQLIPEYAPFIPPTKPYRGYCDEGYPKWVKDWQRCTGVA